MVVLALSRAAASEARDGGGALTRWACGACCAPANPAAAVRRIAARNARERETMVFSLRRWKPSEDTTARRPAFSSVVRSEFVRGSLAKAIERERTESIT